MFGQMPLKHLQIESNVIKVDGFNGFNEVISVTLMPFEVI